MRDLFHFLIAKKFCLGYNFHKIDRYSHNLWILNDNIDYTREVNWF